MNTWNPFRLSLLAALAALSLPSRAAGLSDDFTIDQLGVSNYTAYDLVTDGGPDGLGGTEIAPYTFRNVALVNYENAVPGRRRSRIGVLDGALHFGNDTGVSSVGYVTYNYLGTHLDLSETPDLRVDFLGVSAPGWVYVNLLDWNLVGAGFFEPMQASPGAQSLTFKNITQGLEANHIIGIAIAFDLVGRSELSVNRVQSVPEPASLAALTIGALGLLRRLRARA